MKIIDMDNWSRKQHYELFKNMDYPHFNVCVRLDVTHFYKYIKENYMQFYKSMIFAVTKHVNQIENLKYRFRNNEVVIHDVIHPSFTVLLNNDLFSYCHAKFTSNPYSFFENVNKAISDLGETPCLSDPEGSDDTIYITSIPWTDFTSMTHPIHMNPCDSIPRIAWGKFVQEQNKYMMTMSLQVHHSLADGIHVSRFFEYLQRDLWAPEDLFE